MHGRPGSCEERASGRRGFAANIESDNSETANTQGTTSSPKFAPCAVINAGERQVEERNAYEAQGN
eukprot:scaffold304452_cov33-Tisochrysis_lutea.AAC.6